MRESVTVYYKPGCPFGIRLRAALRLRSIPFEAVRFRDDEAGAAEVRAVNDGNEISPTVKVGDRWLTNPRWRQVAAARGVPSSVSEGSVDGGLACEGSEFVGVRRVALVEQGVDRGLARSHEELDQDRQRPLQVGCLPPMFHGRPDRES